MTKKQNDRGERRGMEKKGEKECQDAAKSMPEEQIRECSSARRGALLALQAMRDVWDADDDTIAKLISKGRQLAPEDRAFILGNLKDYYERADNAIGEGDFYRVDRERWPDLPEEERLETILKTQSDRAALLPDLEQGMLLGVMLERLDVATRMLTRGMPEEQVMDVIQITAEQLDRLKQYLKNKN